VVKQGDPLWFGVDTLRLVIGAAHVSGIIDGYIRTLSANSNEIHNFKFFGEPGFKLSGIQLENKMVAIVSHGPDSLIEFVKMKEGGAIKDMDYVLTFYSAFFHREDLRPLLIRVLSFWEKKSKVTRCDLALDVVSSVNRIWRQVFPVELTYDKHGEPDNLSDWKASKNTYFSKIYVIGRADKKETFYLGSKTKNKKYFVRVYNKKLDSSKKNKFHLFGHYLTAPFDVTRIEVQINAQACKGFGLTVELILQYLLTPRENVFSARIYEYFVSCVGKRSGTFIADVFRINRRTRVHPLPKQTKTVGLESLASALPYIKTMVGYARTLQAYGYDPIQILQQSLPRPFPAKSQAQNTVLRLDEIEQPEESD